MKGLKYYLHFSYLFLYLGTSGSLMGQSSPAKIWATTSFNKKEVMVGEPLVVTITVYTSTWFTKPPVFEEIQVKGALMTRLQQRNSARSVTIGRKQYPAIEQKFVVYPNVVGKNTLASFKVITTCPPDGDYKGREREVYTKERSFEVLPPPENVDKSKWLAAYNVTLTEVWDKSFDNLRAGDILERRITIKATGALAAAIPPLEVPELSFGSLYPKTPLLTNHQNRASFTGIRTEIYSYLLEKDGSFEIPELELPWYNLRVQKMESEKLNPVRVEIKPNEDLAFILTRQKELQEALALEQEEVEEPEKEFLFLGLNWWQLTVLVLCLLALIRPILIGVKKLKAFRKKRRENVEDSEEYYFKMLGKALDKGEEKGIMTYLFNWYDRFRSGRFGPEIKELYSESENQPLHNNMEDLLEGYYKKPYRRNIPPTIYKDLKISRKKLINKRSNLRTLERYRINPK